MKRDCDRIQSRLSSYMDGELAAGDSRRVADHLRLCSKCSRELQVLERTQAALQEIGEVPQPGDQWPYVRSELRQDRRASPKTPPALWWRWAPLAAAAVLVILVATTFWPLGDQNITGIEPYVGLYLLAVNASDVLSSQVSPEEIREFDLAFPVYTPEAMDSWKREGIYFHKLHGQPVIQVFYMNDSGQSYCIFQQWERHALDFGRRKTQDEFVQNQICTKLANAHFNLISWTFKKTLFTVISTEPQVDLTAIAGGWIEGAP